MEGFRKSFLVFSLFSKVSRWCWLVLLLALGLFSYDFPCASETAAAAGRVSAPARVEALWKEHEAESFQEEQLRLTLLSVGSKKMFFFLVWLKHKNNRRATGGPLEVEVVFLSRSFVFFISNSF